MLSFVCSMSSFSSRIMLVFHSLYCIKPNLIFTCFDECLVAFTKFRKFSVITLKGRIFYFRSAAVILKLLEVFIICMTKRLNNVARLVLFIIVPSRTERKLKAEK